MLSPNARQLINSAITLKHRDINDRHLAIQRATEATNENRRAIDRLAADIVALEADLDRDDQARADAGEDAADARAKRGPLATTDIAPQEG